MLSLLASNHAHAIRDGGAPSFEAYVLSHSMIGIFKGRNCFEMRGKPARKSVFSSNFVFVSIVPVKKPAPTGDQGTKPTPNSSQVLRTPFNSTLRVHKEYSDWTADTG